jgi:hypothetical protein
MAKPSTYCAMMAIRRLGLTASYSHGTYRLNVPGQPRCKAVHVTGTIKAMLLAESMAGSLPQPTPLSTGKVSQSC